MKVLLVNGSPHHNGCTFTALQEIEKELNRQGIETELFWIGVRPISGCMGCNQCLTSGRCCLTDSVNIFLDKAEKADGFIFGSPVHFASATGSLTSFMDRVFYGRAKMFSNKPAAAIASCRRGGSTTTFDQLNKYFTISNMPVVSSNYWNAVHGNTPEEVAQDIEGLQTMRILGRNMAWLLKCIEAGKQAGINPPAFEARTNTNFIR
ncbi:MAG TPA: flavodoxin family protein [Candidatus Parabacteroides intestinavium]|nr:flavodoxin family protein [Candidatus Parabacteroides intestinavium]